MNKPPEGKDAHKKEVTIIVNARPKKVTKEEMSFAEIVALAFPEPAGENTIYTVTYRKGHGNKEGTLVEGDFIKVKDGMIFDVTRTDKS